MLIDSNIIIYAAQAEYGLFVAGTALAEGKPVPPRAFRPAIYQGA